MVVELHRLGIYQSNLRHLEHVNDVLVRNDACPIYSQEHRHESDGRTFEKRLISQQL